MKCVKYLVSLGVERKDIDVVYTTGKPVCVIEEDVYYKNRSM